MQILGFLEFEHTLENIVRRRLQQGVDNQTREAIQTIMQELLQTTTLQDNELVEPACAYYTALSYSSPWWPSEEREALLFPILKISFLPDLKEPFQAFRNLFIDGEKMEKKKSGGGLFSRFVDWFTEEGNDEFLSLLPIFLEMSKQSQQHSTCYWAFVARRRNFFIDLTDVFANLVFLKEFCNALDLGTDPVFPGNQAWFQPVFDIELVDDVIKKLASSERARIWTDSRVGKTNLQEDIQAATSYLFNMYSVAGFFSSILSQRKSSIGEAYLQACRANCERLLCFLDGRHVDQSKKLRSGRQAKITWDGYLKHKVLLTQEILEFISNSVTRMEGEGGDFCNRYSKMLDGTSSYALLVEDILSGLYVSMLPSASPKKGYELLQTALEDTDLHPDIEVVVRAWSTKLKDEAE